MPRRIPFAYDTLTEPDAIRLLTLQIAKNGQISADILTTTLRDAPVFYTLSYTWGKNKKDKKITVDGCDFYITKSLFPSLQRLARRSGILGELDPPPKYLWVDQICVNQGSIPERNQQVGIMGRIYLSSARTLVWLGLDDGTVQTALDFCDQIDQIPLAILRSGSSTVERPKSVSGEVLPPVTDKRWRALYHLFRRAWFKRMWVIQEFTLSPQHAIVMCGDRDVPNEVLTKVASWYRESEMFGIYVGRAQADIIYNLYCLEQVRSSPEVDFGDLLFSFRSARSTDPRDKIYGILGIAEQRDHNQRLRAEGLVPDYEKEPAELYRHVARYIIKTTGMLFVLSLSMCRGRSVYCPTRYVGRQQFWGNDSSWTPNFDGPLRPLELMIRKLRQSDGGKMGLAYKPPYNAAPGTTAVLEDPPEDPKVLKLRGVPVDKIVSCLGTNDIHGLRARHTSASKEKKRTKLRSPKKVLESESLRDSLVRLPTYLQSHMVRPQIVEMAEIALKYGRYTEPEELLEALMKVTTGAKMPGAEDQREDDLRLFGTYVDEMCSQVDRTKLSPKMQELIRHPWIKDAAKDGMVTDTFKMYMESYCHFRRFFVTERGYLGMGSSGLRKGDVVAVLWGSQVPFVLRDDGDNWTFAGDTFLHDYMDGQALAAWKEGTLKEQVFEIR